MKSSMGVGAALAVLLLFIATVNAAQGGVSFWKKDVTLTCPDIGTWYDDRNKPLNTTDPTEPQKYTYVYENGKKTFYCEYEENSQKIKYYFYVKGKVCDNCFELDATVFGVVIVADVLGTTIVILIIYRCTKKKSAARHDIAPKTPARPGGRGPAVPNPDYAPLNPTTREQDTYSRVNRMDG